MGEVLGRIRFPVQVIQVDGGSEFMAEFEAVWQEQAITFFVLPPLRGDLHAWEDEYNHLRPHQALG